jgi:hypothetical protein
MSIEKNVPSTSIQRLRVALLAIGLLSAVSATAESQTGCSATAGDKLPLTLDTSVVSSKGSDEWNSDVIRIIVREPGLLLVSAEGPEVQGFVYALDPAGGEPRLLDEEGIGSAGRILALEANSGEYCLQIEPPAGATGSVRVRADLVDLTVPSPE